MDIGQETNANSNTRNFSYKIAYINLKVVINYIKAILKDRGCLMIVVIYFILRTVKDFIENTTKNNNL